MPFEHLNRAQRRAAQSYAVAEAKKRPAILTAIPASQWPPYPNPAHAPRAVWHSQKYLVQMFDEQLFDGIECRRLSVNRVTIKGDGSWEENLTWEELQQVKREIGYGHWYGIEIYPRDIDIVNVANLRHLWLLVKPLSLGWFKDRNIP